MRHGKKINHLGRTASHRKALLANLSISLFTHKRIKTTVAKAKALRKYVEPLLTKSKDDSTTSRRTVFAYLQNKEAVKILFDEIALKIADRPGGYTRIIKLQNRPGDSAEMCYIELVDYNELLLGQAKSKKTRRSRRSSGAVKKQTAGTSSVEADTPQVVAESAIESSENNPTEITETSDQKKEEN
jgi:large subunit ribosomal protein L17